jgi:hypothetical protein
MFNVSAKQLLKSDSMFSLYGHMEPQQSVPGLHKFPASVLSCLRRQCDPCGLPGLVVCPLDLRGFQITKLSTTTSKYSRISICVFPYLASS